MCNIFFYVLEILLLVAPYFDINFYTSQRKFHILDFADAIELLHIRKDIIFNIQLHFLLAADVVFDFVIELHKNLLFYVIHGDLVDSMLQLIDVFCYSWQ